ncbi:hypothetical protein LINGRAPRIM_LOCUS2328 [Linum grandiflorum]
MEDKIGRSNPASMRTSTTTTATSTRLPSPEGSKGGKSKKSLKRFPRVLKAILFETSLAKKIRKRRNAQKGGTGNVNPPTLGNDSLNPSSTPFENGDVEPNEHVSLSSTTFPSQPTPSLTTMSTSSNSTFSSTNSSSTNSSSTDKTTTLPLADAAAGAAATTAPKIILLQQQQSEPHNVVDPTTVVGKGRSNVGLCLVVVSLVVLVFWGKICAIMFTSTWLFFVPHCIPGTATLSGRIGAYYRRIEPEEYLNNKDHQAAVATAEGFVERSRNRARRWVFGLKGRS